jgi:hypothetical protein
VEKVQNALGDKVKEVRATVRLTDSPACLVAGEHDMSAHLERMLKAAGQKVEASKPTLEINPEHVLVKRLAEESDAGRAADLAQVLYDQALLAEVASWKTRPLSSSVSTSFCWSCRSELASLTAAQDKTALRGGFLWTLPVRACCAYSKGVAMKAVMLQPECSIVASRVVMPVQLLW